MRKNQLKRLSLEKLQENANSTTNRELITLINDVIIQKNEILTDQSLQLKAQILAIRKQTKKTIKQMNEAVRDRLTKKQIIIMDRNSRPSNQDIKSLAQLFTYMENQTQLINRNNQTIEKIDKQKQSYLKQLSNSFRNPQQEFLSLDQQYSDLHLACEQQNIKLNQIKQDKDKFIAQINNIHKTIQQYRIKYENVESVIRERQRQLDHLVTYYNCRIQQDTENIQRQRKLSNIIEQEILKNLHSFNTNETYNETLQMISKERISNQA